MTPQDNELTKSTDATNTTKRSRPLTIGLAAGVLAGGAIGLVALSPDPIGAASGDSTTAPVADSADPSSEQGHDESADRPDPGVLLRDVLQPLVDDGTIDAMQADTVAEFLAERHPERPMDGRGRRGPDGHGLHRAVLADLLGIDTDTLRAELDAGSSVADVAEAHGVEIQVVIDGLVADAQNHLDHAVDHAVDRAVDHGLDDATAAERLAELTDRIEEGVYRTRPARATGEAPADAPADEG